MQASLINQANNQNKSGQVYQVDNNNNYSSNNQNWGNNFNRQRRRNFNQPNYVNPNFNPNNFNKGGYSNNPNRSVAQMPTNNNQGWSQMPFGNVNQGPPTYGGQVPNWGQGKTIICYNCQQPGHISTNCSNARAQVDYVPLCGNCNQNGRTAKECNGPHRNESQDGYNNKRKDNSPKIVLLDDEASRSNNDQASYLIQVENKNQPSLVRQEKVVQKVSTRGQIVKENLQGNLEILRGKEITRKEAQQLLEQRNSGGLKINPEPSRKQLKSTNKPNGNFVQSSQLEIEAGSSQDKPNGK